MRLDCDPRSSRKRILRQDVLELGPQVSEHSPMLIQEASERRWPGLMAPHLLLRRHLTRRTGRSATGEEDEPVFADLDLVATRESDVLDALPVDVGAVEAADVPDVKALLAANELRMPPAHRHIVEEDVALRMTPRRREIAVEQEAASEFGPRRTISSAEPVGNASTAAWSAALRSATSSPVSGTPNEIVVELVSVAARPRTAQRRAAVGAEATVLRVLVPALGAEGHRYRPPAGDRPGRRDIARGPARTSPATGRTLDRHSRLMVARQPTCDPCSGQRRAGRSEDTRSRTPGLPTA